MIEPYYNSDDFTLYKGDCLELLEHIETKVDMIFADPPYFLSTGNGRVNINGDFIKFESWGFGQSRWVCPEDKNMLQNYGNCLRSLDCLGSCRCVCRLVYA